MKDVPHRTGKPKEPLKKTKSAKAATSGLKTKAAKLIPRFKTHKKVKPTKKRPSSGVTDIPNPEHPLDSVEPMPSGSGSGSAFQIRNQKKSTC